MGDLLFQLVAGLGEKGVEASVHVVGLRHEDAAAVDLAALLHEMERAFPAPCHELAIQAGEFGRSEERPIPRGDAEAFPARLAGGEHEGADPAPALVVPQVEEAGAGPAKGLVDAGATLRQIGLAQLESSHREASFLLASRLGLGARRPLGAQAFQPGVPTFRELVETRVEAHLQRPEAFPRRPLRCVRGCP